MLVSTLSRSQWTEFTVNDSTIIAKSWVKEDDVVQCNRVRHFMSVSVSFWFATFSIAFILHEYCIQLHTELQYSVCNRFEWIHI